MPILDRVQRRPKPILDLIQEQRDYQAMAAAESLEIWERLIMQVAAASSVAERRLIDETIVGRAPSQKEFRERMRDENPDYEW